MPCCLIVFPLCVCFYVSYLLSFPKQVHFLATFHLLDTFLKDSGQNLYVLPSSEKCLFPTLIFTSPLKSTCCFNFLFILDNFFFYFKLSLKSCKSVVLSFVILLSSWEGILSWRKWSMNDFSLLTIDPWGLSWKSDPAHGLQGMYNL